MRASDSVGSPTNNGGGEREMVEAKGKENCKKDIDAILDAVKELTKTIADFAKENKELAKQIELSRKSGRF